MDAVKALCVDKGITPIFTGYADLKNKDLSARRTYLETLGVRWIDLADAVQKQAYQSGVSAWYDGYMDDDGVHPTLLGAYAMAMQMLKDVPEIMQYDVQ